ncbi:MAG TPA: UDP-2,3-diacylglucosamine diphosphatase [Burkholderiales bacterium]|nr:UDP-2,3-diacylglucosamine diphosphatase [Burkholderiales bacterium]
MHSIFVSDLHLSPERLHINQVFFDFVAGTAARAEAVYILGDLFEYWVGDDDLADSFNASVANALAALSRKGVKLRLMQGNRDVLMGEAFARRCGAELIADPTPLELYGTKTLIMHGDTLCTDDVKYQRFRSWVRNPVIQRLFLCLPRALRRSQIHRMRAESEKHKESTRAEIMDVAPATVERVLREHGYPRLIHGHTHRPARHVHTVDGRRCERWVLNDWYERGGYLRCDGSGCTAKPL